MLKRALSPVDPPSELEARLELTLGSLVDMAAEELEAWELVRDARPAQLEPHRAAGRRGGDRLERGRRARARAHPAQAAPAGATRPASAVDLVGRTLRDLAREARRVADDVF